MAKVVTFRGKEIAAEETTRPIGGLTHPLVTAALAAQEALMAEERAMLEAGWHEHGPEWLKAQLVPVDD